MVRLQLALGAVPLPADASDALAVALASALREGLRSALRSAR
jgi:Holliday junction resolvasome RuvABC endonuclease subunit